MTKLLLERSFVPIPGLDPNGGGDIIKKILLLQMINRNYSSKLIAIELLS